MTKNTPRSTYELLEQRSTKMRRLIRQEELILAVAEDILRLLEEDGVSQTELAQRLGRSKGFVSQVLSGRRNMTLRTLADIADAAGRRVSIGLEENRPLESCQVYEIADYRRREWPDLQINPEPPAPLAAGGRQ